jgi:hypothetical protein
MFSFHKPKIYRSLKGCCICRAKSSSSRFTDSKRYEDDFDKCFMTSESRQGEICNACVLLVKRWKKLPIGSNRNWHHVVDARAGPGTKSIMKMKSKNREEKLRIKKKHKHKKPVHKAKPPQSPGGLSDDIILEDDCSEGSSIGSTPLPSDCSDDEQMTARKGQRKQRGRKKANPIRCSSFLDLTYWKKTEICCGIIFKGVNGEVLVDMKLLRPCRSCKPSPSSASSSSGELTPTHQTNNLLALSAAASSQDSQDQVSSSQEVSQDEDSSMTVDPHDSQDSQDNPMFSSVTMTPESTVPSTPTSIGMPGPLSPTRAAIEAVLDLSLAGRQKNGGISLGQPRCIQMEV